MALGTLLLLVTLVDTPQFTGRFRIETPGLVRAIVSFRFITETRVSRPRFCCSGTVVEDNAEKADDDMDDNFFAGDTCDNDADDVDDGNDEDGYAIDEDDDDDDDDRDDNRGGGNSVDVVVVATVAFVAAVAIVATEDDDVGEDGDNVENNDEDKVTVAIDVATVAAVAAVATVVAVAVTATAVASVVTVVANEIEDDEPIRLTNTGRIDNLPGSLIIWPLETSSKLLLWLQVLELLEIVESLLLALPW